MAGVHAAESDMGAVIFTGTGGVHLLVVLPHQGLAAGRSCQIQSLKASRMACCFWAARVVSLAFSTRFLSAVHILNGVVDADVPQIQRILQQPISIGPVGAVGGVGGHIIPGQVSFPVICHSAVYEE